MREANAPEANAPEANARARCPLNIYFCAITSIILVLMIAWATALILIYTTNSNRPTMLETTGMVKSYTVTSYNMCSNGFLNLDYKLDKSDTTSNTMSNTMSNTTKCILGPVYYICDRSSKKDREAIVRLNLSVKYPLNNNYTVYYDFDYTTYCAWSSTDYRPGTYTDLNSLIAILTVIVWTVIWSLIFIAASKCCSVGQEQSRYSVLVQRPNAIVSIINEDLKRQDREDRKERQENCTICLESMSENIAILLCNHKFHKNCIETWFLRKQNCPICRT